jgi:predicted alpha/beta-fold hydrolase
MRCAAIARSAQASLRSKSLRRILVTAFVLATLSRAIAERDDRLGRITFRVFFSVIFVIFYFSKAVEYPVVKYRHDVWANVEIVEKAKLATRWYAPTFWGFNRHAQTVLLFALGHLEWVWSHLTWNHEAIDAVDGNTLDIFWAGTDEARAGGDELHAFRSASLPVVVLVPGIGGDAQSPYIKRMTRACAANGWRVALHAYWRLDFNNTADLNAVIERIAMENPSAPICAIAFSAGGHLLFKYLQEVGSETPLVAAVTVSGCFDLRGAIHNVKANENGAYELFLNKQLRLCVRRHIARDKRFKPTLDDNGDETAPAEMDPVEFARNVVGPSPPSGDAQVSVLLCTVTFYANLAHSLTRSP